MKDSKQKIQYESENKYDTSMKDDVIDRFINKGENNSQKGPGDKTGASYAFDIYDFANGTYRYEI